jgi:hypothetical protein
MITGNRCLERGKDCRKSDLAGWIKLLHENSIQPIQPIQPIQLFDLVPGKNATDMTHIINAMDLLYTTSRLLRTPQCTKTPPRPRSSTDRTMVS